MTRLMGIDLPAPPELVVPIFLLILVVLSWLIAGLARRAMVRWLGGPQGDRPDKTPPPSLGLPIAGAVLMGGLLMILPELSLPGRLGRWITGAVDITFVMACALGLARVASVGLTEYAARHPSVVPALGVANVAVRVLVTILAAIIALEAVGVPVAPLVTTLGVSSLAVALALQETLANFFAGLYLLAERPVRSGDYIKIFGSEEGYVESIGWRSSRLRTRTNNIVIVPNKIMSQAVLTNYHMPTAPILYTVSIPVDGAADVETVERAFQEEIARAVAEVSELGDRSPVVRLANVTEAGQIWHVVVDVRDIEAQQAAGHQIRKRLLARLSREKIALGTAEKVVLEKAASFEKGEE